LARDAVQARDLVHRHAFVMQLAGLGTTYFGAGLVEPLGTGRQELDDQWRLFVSDDLAVAGARCTPGADMADTPAHGGRALLVCFQNRLQGSQSGQDAVVEMRHPSSVSK